MSYRNDANTAHDIILLSRVPHPMRVERQEDYHVDLIDEWPDRHPPAPYRQPTGQQQLTAGYSPGAVAFSHKEGQPENGAEHTGAKGPWYRTGWGVTAIVIVIILVVGGIVGGVVGGSLYSSSKSNSGNSTTGTGSPNSNGGTSGGGGNVSRTLSQSNNSTSTIVTANPNVTAGGGPPLGTPLSSAASPTFGVSQSSTATPSLLVYRKSVTAWLS